MILHSSVEKKNQYEQEQVLYDVYVNLSPYRACVSHLQEFCGRQVYIGINDLKAGAQVLGAQLWNTTSEITLQSGEKS